MSRANRTLLLQLVEGKAPVPNDPGLFAVHDIDLRYETGSPWAICLDFVADNVTWVFSLDLLSDARLHPGEWTGLGDVLVRAPKHEEEGYGFILRPPAGVIQLWIRTKDIERFQAKATRLQPQAEKSARRGLARELTKMPAMVNS
ncbi:MAG TPA: SsgA family sporulation/cell division regulator [Candidatus Saccharimonadia bacterium]|nr:SsgA family sporulation/cell division regulator [Candidatus Saccharimonadia bacterium]